MNNIATTQYAALFGPIQQFPGSEAVTQREVNGQTIAEFVVRSNWPGQKLVKVTLWPEYAQIFGELAKGDFVAVEGKYTYREVGDKEYHNLSASSFAVLPALPRLETESVVNPVSRTTSRAPSF